MFENFLGKVAEIVSKNGWEQVVDESEIDGWVEDVVNINSAVNICFYPKS